MYHSGSGLQLVSSCGQRITIKKSPIREVMLTMNQARAVAMILDTIRSNEAWEDFGFSGAPTPEAVEEPLMLEAVPLGTTLMKAMVSMHCAVLVRGGFIGLEEVPEVLKVVLWEPDVFISLQADPATVGTTEDVLDELVERTEQCVRTCLSEWEDQFAEDIGLDGWTDRVIAGRMREGIAHFVEVMHCMVFLLMARATPTRRSGLPWTKD